MKTELLKITPAMAKKYLEKNIKINRRLREKRVIEYANDMKNGMWRKSHQGIAFNSDHELIDGQHRLNAIILADVPVEMLVTTGLENETFDIFDNGLNRSTADIINRPVKDVQIAKRIYGIYRNGNLDGNIGSSPDKADRVLDLFPEISEFNQTIGRANIRVFGSVITKTAAILMHIDGNKCAYINYKKLLSVDVDSSSPVVMSFFRGVVCGKITSVDRLDLFERAMCVFDDTKQNKKTITQIKNKNGLKKAMKIIEKRFDGDEL